MLPIKILAMLGAFIVLSAIGFGPAAMLTSSCYKRRLLVSAALSPVIGLCSGHYHTNECYNCYSDWFNFQRCIRVLGLEAPQ